MATITIVLEDLPKGRGAAVHTTEEAPAIGRTRTPAQALAMDLLRTCRQQAVSVAYSVAPDALPTAPEAS